MINVIGKGFVKAASVQLHNKLRIYSDKSLQIVDSPVINIEKHVQQGYTAPLAETGTILVNNIDASCYADVNSQLLANMAMKPLILWQKLNHFFGVPSTKIDFGVNAYALALNRFSSTFLPMLFD